MVDPAVASITVASIIKLNIIWVSLILAVNKCVYFSGLLLVDSIEAPAVAGRDLLSLSAAS
jgi:hypothetical protein